MGTRKKLLVAIVGSLAVIGIGTGVVFAAGVDDDRRLKGNAYERATTTAVEHLGGGTVIDTEVDNDGSAYEVEIRKDDGSVVEVNLNEGFNVMEVKQDGEVEAEGSPNDD